jgi:DNA-binding NarL/FixJ family response regulator
MSQAISFLLRRIDATKSVIEVPNFSKLQEAMLINGQPEAFLIDPLMQGFNGTAGIKLLKKNYPVTPLILFSSIPSDEGQSSCLTAGADLYIEKTATAKNISELIQKQLGWAQKLKFMEKQGLTDEGLMKLSKRQKQLLVLVDAGLCNDDIAKKLDISAHTVKVHLWRFYKKLGISSRTQLSKFARDNGYM